MPATRVPWAAVGVFAVLACGLAWLVQLPLWLGDGLASPWFLPLTFVMMTTPTIAALVVTFTMVRPRRVARYLGLTPFRPVGRKIALFLLWPLLWLALGFGAFFLAVAVGWAQPDWSLEGVASTLPDGVPLTAVVVATFLALPISVALSSVAAFGEELGWRGFLTTALAPLGFWPSAVVSGLLWGVWHAPIILLGYNFFRTDITGVLWMCGFTLVVGVLLQWSRYWTRNVWPVVVGHGALNAAVPSTLLWLSDDADPAIATMLGAPGWIVMGVAIVVLLATGLLGRRLPTPLVPPHPDDEPDVRGSEDAPVTSYGQARAASAPSAASA